MKKFFFSILAVGAMVACTKSEVNYNDASEISFAPVASVATKAAIDGTEYPTTVDFKVFSFYADDVEPGVVAEADFAKFDVTYLLNKTFTHKADGIFKGASHAYYWPKNGSLIFAGYSPDPSKFTSTAQTYTLDDALTITGFVQPATTSKTHDLMWFNHTKSSYREVAKVPVKFSHACSWLTFNVFSLEADAKFHIKKLVLNSVKTKGDFNGKTPTWTLSTDPTYTKEIVVFDADQAVPATGDPLKIDDNGVIVLPQDCVSATITYSMDNGAGVVITQEETFPLSAGTDNGTWKYSRHYTYTINFSATEILIEPSVNKWVEVTGTEVEVN